MERRFREDGKSRPWKIRRVKYNGRLNPKLTGWGPKVEVKVEGGEKAVVRVARYYNNAEVYFIKNVLLTGNLVHPPRRLGLPLYLYLLYLARWPPCGKEQRAKRKETKKIRRSFCGFTSANVRLIFGQ